MSEPVEIPSEQTDGSCMTDPPRDAAGQIVVTDELRAMYQKKFVYKHSWSQDRALAPIPDDHGLFMPQWLRWVLLTDLGLRAEPRRVPAGVSAYYDRFRLTFRLEGRVPGFVDSTGAAHGFPAGVAGFRQLRIEAVRRVGFGADHWQRQSWLLFQDAAGRALLMLPGYGWDIRYQLQPFAAAVGWWFKEGFSLPETRRVPLSELEGEFPGIRSCPTAPVGGPLLSSEERAAAESPHGRRLRR